MLEHIGDTVIKTFPVLYNLLSAQIKIYLIFQHDDFKMANSPLSVFIMRSKLQLI